MADEERKQVNVDFTNYPELYAALEGWAAKDYITLPRMLMQLVIDRIERDERRARRKLAQSQREAA
jgi:hypothetical protein